MFGGGARWVALLASGSAAYKLKDREAWIGWNNTRRAERLKLVAQNRRYLLLGPKGRHPNRASQVFPESDAPPLFADEARATVAPTPARWRSRRWRRWNATFPTRARF